MSTTSATEAARQPNSELDPAIAGLGAPEAPLPTWEEAFANAKVLQEQGVNIRVHDGQKWILICDGNGKLHDPADGTPAVQGFYSGGTPMWIDHYANGELQNPDNWTPASRGFYPDGTPMWIGYYTDGRLHDPADGTPARQEFYQDGSPEWISRWTAGSLASEERFPPSTGVA